MPFLLTEILNFQGSKHFIGVGSLSKIYFSYNLLHSSIDTSQNHYQQILTRIFKDSINKT